MFFEPGRDGMRPAPLTHTVTTSLVVPRPIGWISTVTEEGVANLAPFSFFNLVSSDPPCVMYCPGGWKSGEEGVYKDTLANVEATGEFVFSMCTSDLAEQMNLTAAHLPRGVDEMAAAGLAAAPSRLVRPPRVEVSPIALECRFMQKITLPPTSTGAPNDIVIGEVVGVYIDDEVIVDGVIDVGRVRPLARMGGLDYAHITAEQVFSMRRPD